MKIPTPRTIKGPIDWGQFLFQLSPLSMKSQAVPLAQSVGSGLNQLFTGNEAVPQAATDFGYALRGMTNLNPYAGGMGMRQLIPEAGGFEPTTPREQAIQDVSQGLYGGALMSPLMTGGAVGAGLKQLATQTLPKALAYSAGIGSTIKMGQNVAGGNVPSPTRGGGMETLEALTAGVPEAAGKAMQYGVKLMPMMQGVQLGVEGIAKSIPALNQLTEKGIQSYKPGAGATVAEWLKSVGNVGVRRLVRATLIETPIEALTYGMANKMPKASLIKSIENEVVPNLIYNLGYAGMATADDTLAPMIKDQVSQAILRMSNPLPSNVPAGQEGFIAGAKAPSFGKLPQFVPTFEGENAPPRVMISDKGAKLNIPDNLNQKLFLSDVLDHPKLYAEYPDAEVIPVEFDPTTDKSGTYFLGRTPDKIVLGTSGRTQTQIKGDLLHEVQHTIQTEEGFSPGTTMATQANNLPPGTVGNNDYRNWVNYMAEPGEVEARAVTRMQNVGQSKLGTFEPYAGDQYGPVKNPNFPQLSLPLEETAIPTRQVPMNKGGYRVGSVDIPETDRGNFVSAGKPITAGDMQQFRQHPLLTEFENAYNAGDKQEAQAAVAKMTKTPEVSGYAETSQDVLNRMSVQASLPAKYPPNIVDWVKNTLLTPTTQGQDLVGDLTMVGLELQDANALVDLKHQIQAGQVPPESMAPEVERIMSGIQMPLDFSMPVIKRENPMSKYQIQSNIPTPRTADWANATLANDQASTDEQMRQYFLNNGLTYEQTQRLIELRPQFLSGDLYSAIDGSPLTETVKKIVGGTGVQANIPEPNFATNKATRDRLLAPIDQALTALNNVGTPNTPWGAKREIAIGALESLRGDVEAGRVGVEEAMDTFKEAMGRQMKLGKATVPKR